MKKEFRIWPLFKANYNKMNWSKRRSLRVMNIHPVRNVSTTFLHPKLTFSPCSLFGVFPTWNTRRIIIKQETSTTNQAKFWCCFGYWYFYTTNVNSVFGEPSSLRWMTHIFQISKAKVSEGDTSVKSIRAILIIQILPAEHLALFQELKKGTKVWDLSSISPVTMLTDPSELVV